MDRDLDLDNNEKGGTDVLVVVDGRPAAVPALPDWLCVPRVPVNGKLQLIPHLQQQRLLRSQFIVYTRAGTLLWVYRQYIAMPYIAITRQAWIYRDISDSLSTLL